MSVAETATED